MNQRGFRQAEADKIHSYNHPKRPLKGHSWIHT
jgi:hypothetical protein